MSQLGTNRLSAHRLVVLSVAVFLTASAVAAAQTLVSTQFDSAELPTLARSVSAGDRLVLEGVDLRADGVRSALEFERFEVFARDAQIVVHGEDGERRLPAPDNRYFRGRIAGEPRSSAFLTVLASGGVRGIAASGGEYWVMSAEEEGTFTSSGLQLRRLDASTEFAGQSGSFACGTDQLDLADPQRLANLFNTESVDLAPARASTRGANYTARVAIETDYELFTRLGSTQATTDYIGDLFAYLSGLYTSEVQTSLLLSHVSLWTTSADPWTQSATSCGLFQFGRYWNDNNSGVERTIAHFLSGKTTSAGIAWVGVLCSGGFTYPGGATSGCPGLVPDVDNYGGAYGYTSGISGSFTLANPNVVWDVVALSHEIGHNFNSPHTHCYGGLGGVASPVDTCNSSQCGGTGCFCGTPSLPCAQSGAGCGTLMSYCHLLGGGLSNISLTFGQNHPFGTSPDRVPMRMNDHVVSTAALVPSCLELAGNPDMIFSDGFESGDASSWIP